MNAVIMGTIGRNTANPVNIYTEYLDMVRFPVDLHQKKLFDLIRDKYTNTGPGYSIFSTQPGEGVIGGRMLSIEHPGEEAGELAVRILPGEAAESIALIRDSFSSNLFDRRQLKRHGIPESRLPEGSLVLYKQIAYELTIAEQTVKIHRGRITQKLGASSIADPVRMAQMADISPAQAG
jgi:hypothetical protein